MGHSSPRDRFSAFPFTLVAFFNLSTIVKAQSIASIECLVTDLSCALIDGVETVDSRNQRSVRGRKGSNG